MSPVCQLCNETGVAGSVRALLVEWLEPVFPGRRWESIDRCVDRVACRARLEATGTTWPVRDPGTSLATVSSREVGQLLTGHAGPAGSDLVDVVPEEFR